MSFEAKTVAAMKCKLRVEQTEIGRARFPMIDAHSHPYARTEGEIRAWAALDGELNLRKVVLLTGASGSEFREIIDRYESAAPGRWIYYAGLDPTGVGEPGYSDRAIAALEQAARDGAMGVGEIVDKGRGPMKAERTKLFDDACYDPVWSRCAELGLPINIHVGEPEAFYDAPDESNELSRSALWSLYGQSIPPLREMLRRFDDLAARHRDTRFVLAHFGNIANDLSALGDLLERNPNVVTDMSARVWELARQPYTARRFFMRYQDRILFGTDLGFDAPMYRQHIRFLETDDEWFAPPDAEWWMGYGIHLPAKVLRKIYGGNAARISALTGRRGR